MRRLMMTIAVLGLMGCASAPISADKLGHPEESIRGAEEVGALNVPAAKLHLQLAKDQAATAKKLAEQGDGRAILVMACAESDAELALGLAREVAVHADALKATEDLKSLRARGTQ